jgi:transcriptional regulator with XRE-family HTH domain
MIADMIIGDRLRAIRHEKGLSQGDIEKRTGLLRVYISRIENDHTVPSIGTLEKMALALEVPLYVLFYEGEEPPDVPESLERIDAGNIEPKEFRKESLFLRKFRRVLGQVGDEHPRLLLFVANKMALRKTSKPQRAK